MALASTDGLRFLLKTETSFKLSFFFLFFFRQKIDFYASSRNDTFLKLWFTEVRKNDGQGVRHLLLTVHTFTKFSDFFALCIIHNLSCWDNLYCFVNPDGSSCI